jgi:BlaI family transcriptional regulator, penicillinase repressor
MSISFTERELDVMAVLWQRGSGTVAEVRDALDGDFAYNTVLTVLRTLEDKGRIEHVVEGKAHRYIPVVTQDAAGESALARVLHKLFDGSHELLLTQLVSEKKLGEKDLLRLRKLLDERLAARKKRSGS